MKVQGWVADDPTSESEDGSFVALSCLACRQSHVVDPKTGKVMGVDQE
jgi:hypothetical protein